ncbi:MAG: GyrI-like domain-containing protein [Candidatus Cloacimonetes bacterium]|nr:GyrI-like domain-containing protein [Candidatus Cloacimonadota bacterium]
MKETHFLLNQKTIGFRSLDYLYLRMRKYSCELLRRFLPRNIDTKYMEVTRGLCLQCLLMGSYDTEPETLKRMENYYEENDLLIDMIEERRYHEIYLSDLRKTKVSKRKTVLRIPLKENN